MPRFQLDDHDISWVGWNTESGYETVRVGCCGVTKIVHRELFCGENSIHWLEAWTGSTLSARFNAASVDSIHYDDKFVGNL